MSGPKLALAAVAVALLSAFAALAVSVVDARRPLDRDLPRSFEATVSKLVKSPARAELAGCHKITVAFYDCTVDARPRRLAPYMPLLYRVWLTDDLCWSAVRESPAPVQDSLAAFRPKKLRGCLPGAADAAKPASAR